MDYINNTLSYLKETLNNIKSAINTTKDVINTIGDIIGTIISILGFIGFKVFILLMTTAFILWLLNLVSPINRKMNYIVAVGLVIWLAITSKMEIQIVVLKYIIIIISPFVITFIINFLAKNLKKLFYITVNKIYTLFSKLDIKLTNKNYRVKNGDDIGLILSSDLPSIIDIENAKDYINKINYNLKILGNEKISLTDNNGKIIFLNESKINQLIKSAKSKDIKLLWFWSESYGSNEIINKLNKQKIVKQNKAIVGSGDNGYILNFLQQKWKWKIIYGKNLKDFITSNYNNHNIDLDKIIFNKKQYELSLINNYLISDNYFLKEKIVGGNLLTIVNSIATYSQLNFKNMILFLDCSFKNKIYFYKALNHLQQYMLANNIFPKAIIIASLDSENSTNIHDIISNFSNNLIENNVNIPIFYADTIKFITLNTSSNIIYTNNKIILNII